MSRFKTSEFQGAAERRTIAVMVYQSEPVSKEDVGARLRRTREALGWSQPDLIRRMAMGDQLYPSKWGNYETGDNYPPADILSRFYQVTGANADWITRGIATHLPDSLLKALHDQENGLAGRPKRDRA